MTIFKNNIVVTASILMLFAIAGAVLVGLTFTQTEDDIAYNEKLTLLRQLNTIVPAELYNNELLLDTLTIKPDRLLGTKQDTLVYRARKNNQNIAAVFSSIAPNGYNGAIHLLVGIFSNGQIAGVRVVKHKETPGLGDAVSVTHSDWILDFDKKSLSNPGSQQWKVKRDGGIFDQFTGATITPRAVVKAVHNALLYFKQNQALLFSTAFSTTKSTTKKPTIKIIDKKTTDKK